jgi:bacteriocin biosynthesis cyclodehydratase domain-containing protein
VPDRRRRRRLLRVRRVTPYYQLAPGVDVVPLNDDALLFRSATLSIKVDGSMAVVLRERVLPLLRQPRRFDELHASLPELAADDLQASLDSLAEARVLRRSAQPPTSGPEHPFAAFANEVGVDWDLVRQRLDEAAVAIFGLEAHGAHLAVALARLGIGALTLADSFPIVDSDALLLPEAAYRPGLTRQAALGQAIAEVSNSTAVTYADELSREAVAALAHQKTLLVGCFDRGYEAAQHWVNRAAVAANVPALFAEISTHVATVGPGVLPGQTACYMCYRMRRIACDENYEESMAYERFLNERKQPAFSSRATAPALPAYVASLLANEVFKLIALRHPMTLGGKVLQFDALTLETHTDSVLRQPECPACRPPKKARESTQRSAS